MHEQRSDGECLVLGLRCIIPCDEKYRLFSDLEEKYFNMHIDMGDEERYNMTRIGTITF